ncbi:MAG TPA: MerR family transcriptional regulator [Propionicimonas sp.]|nr:MerR family transcriptional regulator [Propionicimonas sp.]HRA07424.1 MerR family transcriptional regulator [Propionicimonas sp.]
MLTIKQAAQRTGLSVHTLRAWERRYGVFAPARSEAGYRVYDDAVIARISSMQELVASGWSPRRAAAEVGRRAPTSTAAGDDQFGGLVAAVAALDQTAVARILDARFAESEFEQMVDAWLLPAMARLGQEWASGRISVAEEHFVSNMVMRRLAGAYEAANSALDGVAVLVGAPAGLDHELGLMAFAVAARRVGVRTVYLGAQVPMDAWRLAAEKSGAMHAVTAVHRRRDVDRVVRLAATLAEPPQVVTWVGGSQQHRAGSPCHPLGHSIAEAAKLIRAQLGAPNAP